MIASSPSPLALPTSYSTPPSPTPQAHLLFLNESRTRVKVVLGEIPTVNQPTTTFAGNSTLNTSEISSGSQVSRPANPSVPLEIPSSYSNSSPSINSASNNSPTENQNIQVGVTNIQHSYSTNESEENSKTVSYISYAIEDSNFVNYISKVDENSQNVLNFYTQNVKDEDISADLDTSDDTDDGPENAGENVVEPSQSYRLSNKNDDSLDMSNNPEPEPKNTAASLPPASSYWISPTH